MTETVARRVFDFLTPKLGLTESQFTDFATAAQQCREWRWRRVTTPAKDPVSGRIFFNTDGTLRVIVDPDHFSHQGRVEWSSEQGALSKEASELAKSA